VNSNRSGMMIFGDSQRLIPGMNLAIAVSRSSSAIVGPVHTMILDA